MITKDEVVSIPVGMEKFFGGCGEMVRPSVETVVKLVKQIPHGKVTTIEALRSQIAQRFEVFAACPAATMKSVMQAIEQGENFCYWRLVKKGGQIISGFPGGIKEHKQLLEQEGFVIDESGKAPIVEDFASRLHVFR